MAGDRDLDRIYASILDCAIQVLGGEAAFLVANENGQNVRLVRRRSQVNHAGGLVRSPLESGGIIGRVLETRNPVAICPASDHPDFSDLADGLPGVKVRNYIAVPCTDRTDKTVALVVMNNLRFDGSIEEDLSILGMLANQIAVAGENFRLYKRLEQLAITDELTQVYNYRFLKAALRKEVKRSARFGLEFAILMVDVDNLKLYNEANGHLGGSGLLRTLASLLTKNARSVDLVAKYGGDEFMIILPQTGPEGAEIMAGRVRAEVEAHQFRNVERGAITISIGVASFPGCGQSVEQLISSADTALYTAKRGGRNRVVIAGAAPSAKSGDSKAA